MKYYKILISGPSDVNDYIDIARSTILETNILAGPLGVQFEPFDWLESVTPGIDVEPQAVINAQADGYAAIVAIFGAKLGSKTENFDSGTIEELEIAISKKDQLPFGSSSIMVFFKDQKLDIKTSDLSAAIKVQEFRSKLGPKGILFKDFDKDEKFRQNLLRCLGTIIANHLKGLIPLPMDGAPTSSSTQPKTTSPNQEEPDGVIEELGLLDLNELHEETVGKSTAAIGGISLAMTAMTELISDKTTELDDKAVSSNPKKVRAILAVVAESMAHLANVIHEKAPEVAETYKEGVGHIRSVVELSTSEFPGITSQADVDDLRDVIMGVMASAIEAKSGIESFIPSIKQLPLLTKEIGSARRKLSKASDYYVLVLDEVVAETQSLLDYLNSKKV